MKRKINYKHFQTGNKVIAVSSFGGRAVRGIAKCDPRDQFDFETGKEIAEARCNYKIAKKRLRFAEDQCDAIGECLRILENEYARSLSYYKDAQAKLVEAENSLK